MNKIFLFPLQNSVLYKKVTLPYHIFEPRYQKMIQEAIRTQTPVAIVHSDPHGHYEGSLCVGGVPHVLATYPDGRLDIYITGATKYRLTKEEAETQPYKIYEGIEVKENLAVDDSCVMEIESLRLLLEHWSVTYLPHPDQREAFFNTLNDEELLVNYCAVFLVDDIRIKEQIMMRNSIKDKIDLLVKTLGPKEIQLSQFLPPLRFT